MTQHPQPRDDAPAKVANYRLIASVKRGVDSDFDEVWKSYPTVEAARVAGQSLSRNERVGHVLIAQDSVPPTFVEWVA